jgi:hypothetical protein
MHLGAPMATVYKVDFKNKKLVSRETVKVDASDDNIAKFAYFSELLERGMTQLVFDGTNDKAIVPGQIADDPAARVNWSYNFNLDDFEYDESQVCGTLTFSGEPFYVVIPWESVWMIYRPDEGPESATVWHESAPDDVY